MNRGARQNLPDRSGSSTALGLAMLLVCVGVGVSLALVIARPRPDPIDLDPMAQFEGPPPVGAPAAIRLAYLKSRLEEARTPQARASAALTLTGFLMRAQEWGVEEHRLIMARNYLLASLDLDLSPSLQRLAIENLFVLGNRMDDSYLFNRGQLLLRQYEADETAEPVSFSLYMAYVDGLLTRRDPEVYTQLAALSERATEPEEVMQHRMRLARSIRLAVEHGDMREALFARSQQPLPADLEAILLERLEEHAAELMNSRLGHQQAEGFWHQAFVEVRRENRAREIELLRGTIARGATAWRPLAYERLAQVYQEEGRDADFVFLLARQMNHPQTREQAVTALLRRLEDPVTPDVARASLRAISGYVSLSGPWDTRATQLLISGADLALSHGWTDTASSYLNRAADRTRDRRLLADIQLVRARMADIEKRPDDMLYHMQHAIAYHPGHPLEGDVRFQIFNQLLEQQASAADLVGGITGAVLTRPHDPRGAEGLIEVAKHLEAGGLYSLAENYYRRAILVASLQQTREASLLNARALLGQARVLWARGQWTEADALLRSINGNQRWSAIWPESGPLWATIAFQQGQAREGVRRWRVTSGPPSGQLLPYLFEVLVPDLTEWSVRVEGAAVRRPARIPLALMRPAINAVIDTLLANEDYEAIARLLVMVEEDEDWRDRLPLREFRTRWLAHMAATEPLERLLYWFGQDPALREIAELEGLMTLEDLVRRRYEVENLTRATRL